MKTPYKSIFKNSLIAGYIDDMGNEWRREDKGFTYHFFKEQDDAFIFDGAMKKPRSFLSLKKTHIKYIEMSCEEKD